MSQREPEKPPLFCPNCGAATVPGLTRCRACGQSLYSADDHALLWGRENAVTPYSTAEIIDLYPAEEMSSQATTPFTQTRPFEPEEREPEPEPEPEVELLSPIPVDPWSSSGGRLARGATSTLAPAGTAVSVSSSTEEARSGPSSMLLGCIGVLLILAVGALLAWGGVRSVISNQVEDEISIGISNELRNVDQVTVATSGRMRITEDDINDELRRNAKLYEPVKDASVGINPEEVTISFSLYGVGSTFRTKMAVDDGRIVLVDPSLSGPAGRLVDVNDVAVIFETEVAELLRRSNVRPTQVSLRDGSVVITTEPSS
jgi:hypothetical protein